MGNWVSKIETLRRCLSQSACQARRTGPSGRNSQKILCFREVSGALCLPLAAEPVLRWRKSVADLRKMSGLKQEDYLCFTIFLLQGGFEIYGCIFSLCTIMAKCLA
jgi:hypothetical protein